MAASVSTAVAHVVRFLTAKLSATYPPDTVLKLQTALDANLSSHYASSWYPNDPIRGSALRCITLSPSCLPPNPIWSACTAANVQWFDWMKLLGNTEFDLFVDPGCVAFRLNGQIYNIWSDSSSPSAAAAAVRAKAEDHIHACDAAPFRSRKTLAQQLVEEDREDDEQLFHLLNDKITSVPAWSPPPNHAHFSIPIPIPVPGRSISPLSCGSEPSRCSSRSSNTSSSGFSHYSGDTTSSRTSATSGSPKSTSSSSGAGLNGQHYKQSRRERARQARVFVDTSKKEVTPYDGGKTTVLTGGVMLGGAAKPIIASAKCKKLAVTDAISNSNSRRSVRA